LRSWSRRRSTLMCSSMLLSVDPLALLLCVGVWGPGLASGDRWSGTRPCPTPPCHLHDQYPSALATTTTSTTMLPRVATVALQQWQRTGRGTGWERVVALIGRRWQRMPRWRGCRA
jgi:hypothetical protein